MSKYTIINAGITTVVKNIDVDGEPATINQEKLVVELVPDDGISGTIKLVLSPSLVADWPMGSEVETTFTVNKE